MSIIAFLDACVLYPATLRDVLLILSESGLYQVRWSSDVLDEMERNLVKAAERMAVCEPLWRPRSQMRWWEQTSI